MAKPPLLLLLTVLPLALMGFEAAETNATANVNWEDEWMRNRREDAAEFRLERARFTPSTIYEAKAQAELNRARTALEQGELRAANNISWEAYNRYRFSSLADDLLHLSLTAAIERDHLPRTNSYLVDLWLRYPDYEHMGRAFAQALQAAEESQRENATIDLEAEDPDDIIDKSFWSTLFESRKIFDFLATYGDRQTIAPRASLGIARSLMIRGSTNKEKLFAAREAYVDFITNHPRSDLMFQALFEQAITHLLGYRGPAYDGAALQNAQFLVNQAAFYVEEDPVRASMVRKLRDRLRGWRQAKELYIADWYKGQGDLDAAIYYYREALEGDRDSEQGRQAARALAALDALDGPAPTEP